MGRTQDFAPQEGTAPGEAANSPAPASRCTSPTQAESSSELPQCRREQPAPGAVQENSPTGGAVQDSVSPQKTASGEMGTAAVPRKRGRPPRFGEAMSNSLRSRLKRDARREEIGATLRLLTDLLLTDSPEAAAFKLEIGEIRGYGVTAARVLEAYGLADQWSLITARLTPGASGKGK